MDMRYSTTPRDPKQIERSLFYGPPCGAFGTSQASLRWGVGLQLRQVVGGGKGASGEKICYFNLPLHGSSEPSGPVFIHVNVPDRRMWAQQDLSIR